MRINVSTEPVMYLKHFNCIFIRYISNEDILKTSLRHVLQCKKKSLSLIFFSTFITMNNVHTKAKLKTSSSSSLFCPILQVQHSGGFHYRTLRRGVILIQTAYNLQLLSRMFKTAKSSSYLKYFIKY